MSAPSRPPLKVASVITASAWPFDTLAISRMMTAAQTRIVFLPWRDTARPLAGAIFDGFVGSRIRDSRIRHPRSARVNHCFWDIARRLTRAVSDLPRLVITSLMPHAKQYRHSRSTVAAASGASSAGLTGPEAVTTGCTAAANYLPPAPRWRNEHQPSSSTILRNGRLLTPSRSFAVIEPCMCCSTLRSCCRRNHSRRLTD